MSPLAVFGVLLAQAPALKSIPEQPLTDFTVRAMTYIFIAIFLVAVLLIGAGVVLNYTLMSKRKEDLIGGRSPGEVGIIRNKYPETPYQEHMLPAEDEEEEEKKAG